MERVAMLLLSVLLRLTNTPHEPREYRVRHGAALAAHTPLSALSDAHRHAETQS